MTNEELIQIIGDSATCTIVDGRLTVETSGFLTLRNLTTLPEGANLSAGGYLFLNNLKTLPEGANLSAGSYLFLSNLKTLPEGANLSAGGSLHLYSLTSETQTYQGQTIRLRMVDGICTRLIRKRMVGDVTLWSAQYFKGHLDTDFRCYVAEQGEYTAHGDTPENAIRDLRFKIARENFDASELTATIRERGTVERNDFRLITGACESGLREGMRAAGLDPEAEELPLAVVMEKAHGPFGDAFREAMQ